MKKLSTAACLASFLCCGVAHADTPISDKAAFEAKYLQSIKDGPVAECLPSSLSGHFIPGGESVAAKIPQVTELLSKWLGSDKVYKVHPLKSTVVAELFDERSYIVEDTRGAIMAVSVRFRCVNGAWYLYAFNITSNHEELSQMLGIQL